METREFLCISRGQWDPARSRQEIQRAIDGFYVWIDRLVVEGRARRGQRLGTGGRIVAQNRLVTDGPYGEAKELVGGYWFILARSLDEAVEIVSSSPCLACGLVYELRPIDVERASAFTVTNETPRDWS